MPSSESDRVNDNDGLLAEPAKSLRQWFLIMAKPNQDERAQSNLLRQGYEVYRPLARVPKKKRGKRVVVVESLFPRYLFIHLQQFVDNWAPIRSTYGVLTLVRFGLQPAMVPDDLISFLQENEGVFEKRAVSLEDFKKGERVRIVAGALQGCEAIFQRYDGNERAILLLKFLGQMKKITLPVPSIIGV